MFFLHLLDHLFCGLLLGPDFLVFDLFFWVDFEVRILGGFRGPYFGMGFVARILDWTSRSVPDDYLGWPAQAAINPPGADPLCLIGGSNYVLVIPLNLSLC